MHYDRSSEAFPYQGPQTAVASDWGPPLQTNKQYHTRKELTECILRLQDHILPRLNGSAPPICLGRVKAVAPTPMSSVVYYV